MLAERIKGYVVSNDEQVSFSSFFDALGPDLPCGFALNIQPRAA